MPKLRGRHAIAHPAYISNTLQVLVKPSAYSTHNSGLVESGSFLKTNLLGRGGQKVNGVKITPKSPNMEVKNPIGQDGFLEKKDISKKKTARGFFDRIFGSNGKKENLHNLNVEKMKRNLKLNNQVSVKQFQGKKEVGANPLNTMKRAPKQLEVPKRDMGVIELNIKSKPIAPKPSVSTKKTINSKDIGDIDPIWVTLRDSYLEDTLDHVSYFQRYIKRAFRGLEVRRGEVLDRHEYSKYWKNLIRAVYAYEAFTEKTAKRDF